MLLKRAGGGGGGTDAPCSTKKLVGSMVNELKLSGLLMLDEPDIAHTIALIPTTLYSKRRHLYCKSWDKRGEGCGMQ